jgi:nucleoside-diphosphate-sugar epimerase
VLRGDIRDPDSARAVLKDHVFDVVVDWIAFTPERRGRPALFRGRTAQYVFISSASAYQTPPSRVPITESTPLDNPVWLYSRNKIACEECLMRAHREERFPVTVVRPSHTYDKTRCPLRGGYTMIDRMRKGQRVIVHGDGSSLWTMTHHRDFARGFVGLLGNDRAIGHAFHITSDEVLTWNQIYLLLGRAAGVEPRLVHVPSDLIAAYDKDWGDSLLGDKTHSMIFDNARSSGWCRTSWRRFPLHRGPGRSWPGSTPIRPIVRWMSASIRRSIASSVPMREPGRRPEQRRACVRR